jgi:hypothetical protein
MGYEDAYSGLMGAGAGNFSYNLDENDPELAMLRRRAQFLGGQNMMRGSDELGRAGLLGSGVGMNYIQGIGRDTARNVSDIEGGLFGRRRNEALGLFTRDQDWARQVEMEKARARMAQMQSQDSMWGGLGNLLGQGALLYATGGMSEAGGLFGGKK